MVLQNVWGMIFITFNKFYHSGDHSVIEWNRYDSGLENQYRPSHHEVPKEYL